MDACGVRRVTNPFASGVTMVASDLKSRKDRLGLQRNLQVKCPVTGLLLEPRANVVGVNLEKQSSAYNRTRKVYVRTIAELAIQSVRRTQLSVRRTQLFTERTNEKRVPVGAKADPFQ